MNNIEIKKQVLSFIGATEYDAFIITGYDNIHYMTGLELPFAPYRKDQFIFLVIRRGTVPVLICPTEWLKSAIYSSWFNSVMPYGGAGNDLDGAMKMVASYMSGVSKIAVDFEATQYRVFETLQKKFPDAELINCDEALWALRTVKCETEKELLAQNAYLADHGLNGAIHHVTVDRRTSSLTMAEEFRVHTLERGIDMVGYHGSPSALPGKLNDHIWTESGHFGYSPTVDFAPGDMIRLNLPACRFGYWTDETRIMTMGDMLENQEASYNQLVALREAACAAIKPGNTAADVYDAMVDFAEKNNIPLQADFDLGHSIGASLYEGPLFNPADTAVLCKDMVFVVAPIIKDADGLYWIQKDTVIVTEDGCEIVGWYKDWREPYIPISSI